MTLHHTRQITEQIANARATIARERRNVSASFPDVLDGVDGNGMIMLALLRQQTAAVLGKMDVATLRGMYIAALQRQDVAGLCEAEVIERLAEQPYAASDPSERPIRWSPSMRCFRRRRGRRGGPSSRRSSRYR